MMLELGFKVDMEQRQYEILYFAIKLCQHKHGSISENLWFGKIHKNFVTFVLINFHDKAVCVYNTAAWSIIIVLIICVRQDVWVSAGAYEPFKVAKKYEAEFYEAEFYEDPNYVIT